ncbi:MAG: YdcF family protein [Acetobacteraceae bacterium]
MPFKAIAIALLIPPMSLVFLALAGLLLGGRYRRLGRVIGLAGLLGLLVLGMPAVGDLLLISLEQHLPLTPPPADPPQAIVVLGANVVRGNTDSPSQALSGLSLDRVRTGAMLARRTGLPLLLTGGALRRDEPPVAQVMADAMVRDFHTPVRWVEAVSQDTWQNARLSAAILHDQGIRSVYVVTQAWHMKRAITAFDRAGIVVTAAPTRMDLPPVPLAADFVPTTGAWSNSYYAIHEWLGWAWYSLR